jgi:hypothetical protein
MCWCFRISLAGILMASLSLTLFSQANICQAPPPSVPPEMKMQLLQLQAEERARDAAERATWTANILPVKYATSENTLKPLCIFGIEVVPQPAMKLVAIRAPKELMPAIEEAIKRLDVPVQPAKSVELTGYVIFATDVQAAGTEALPNELQPVANQLKNILPGKTLSLADRVLLRGIDGQRVNVTGKTEVQAVVSIREGSGTPFVHLDNLYVNIGQGALGPRLASFNTNVDVPVGTNVVIGQVTPAPTPVPAGGSPTQPKAVILVMTAKIVN